MNAGVETILKRVGLAIRLGSRFASEASRAEARGVNGILNLEFTGDDGGWHFVFDDGSLRTGPGLLPDPRATVRVKSEDFLALVAGDASFATARMTGKVRVSGDGNLGMFFDGFVGSLQNARAASGLRGWLARGMIRSALRKGGYVPRSQRPAVAPGKGSERSDG